MERKGNMKEREGEGGEGERRYSFLFSLPLFLNPHCLCMAKVVGIRVGDQERGEGGHGLVLVFFRLLVGMAMDSHMLVQIVRSREPLRAVLLWALKGLLLRMDGSNVALQVL